SVMITKESLPKLLNLLGFKQNKTVWTLKFPQFDCSIKVDFKDNKIIYPTETGFSTGDNTTCNFSHNENFVVLECVCRLLNKGYRPEHIVLEKEWQIGRSQKGGKADICVKGLDEKILFIIECKTPGTEYESERYNMINYGGQLFSYWQQEKSTQWLLLYTSDIENDIIKYWATDSVSCLDYPSVIESSAKDPNILTYEKAKTNVELYTVWDKTYEKRFFGDVIFSEDTKPYVIGEKPLRFRDLQDFSEADGIVNKFEEILRHNNVSDKENAFNRLVAMFIAKLYDENHKHPDDEVEFQYRKGTDSYEDLQDRLQKLHQKGMKEYMNEEVIYVEEEYPENLIQQYSGRQRARMLKSLKDTIRKLKFYTNNDFAFKDVHNEKLFFQNGKILVEMMELFQQYRITGVKEQQKLGDLFEKLLNKGFKQNEGQFFTAMPITRFIWHALPLKSIIRKDANNAITMPKIIDYACGAGHFLTEGYQNIVQVCKELVPGTELNAYWVRDKIFGIEKDYRLSRVSKISMYMYGAGGSKIIFGDGLGRIGNFRYFSC
ncbi:MAG: type I restriction enzyme HsdR N-terminal domain-containing protein, partial [bacterium]|nr:type I restriction enzyme HsdR N-terminal domain-containing protein [bacterium]